MEAYLYRLGHWLRDWRISVNVSKSTAILFTTRRIKRPRPIQFLGEPVAWVETAQYLGVTLDTRLTWSAHINQIGRMASQRLGVLGPLLNRRSGFSIRNGVLLYKQQIRPVIDYAGPVWRSAACSHVRKLQVLQSKCLRIATNASWYVGNRQIHKDFGNYFFRRLSQGINQELRLKVIWLGEPLSSATWKTPTSTKGCLKPSQSTEEDGCIAGQSRSLLQGGEVDATCSTQHCSATLTEVFRAFPQL
jgi:hypothetical protein